MTDEIRFLGFLFFVCFGFQNILIYLKIRELERLLIRRTLTWETDPPSESVSYSNSPSPSPSASVYSPEDEI